ncbi:MAG: tRNA (adenosine(37)-N6)-threonylcarbamoyltransferase complex dimerization subunit type 1 TsaB [Planctomycetaceae bacterium]|nr:tRNA (adenosine(37)-N6)-threonylcarbamoyltransferase complex dimerization subunit type 1 TsaB [Planctomycetaceae bacterium]
MNILAVDTSGFGGSVACRREGQPVVQRSLSTQGRRHAQTLVLEVRTLLNEVGLRPADIDVVAVSIGPGSFTGLRVGVVFAKTFAWANDASLVAVDTFRAIAQQAGDCGRSVAVVSDAQRQEAFFNTYHWDPTQQCAVADGSIRIVPVAQVVQAAGDCIWSGPGIDRFADAFADVEVAADREPTATAIAQIGRIQCSTGDTADLSALEPLYIRRSYAEENAVQKAEQNSQEGAGRQT